MDLVKDTILVNETIHRDFSEIAVEGDIIVPDVKPDILKILQVDAISQVNSKELQNGRMTVSGKVNLKILYIPDKAEESVKSIITAFDFSHQIENQSINDTMQAFAECDVAKVDFTLLNSRKLNIKATVAMESSIVCSKNIDVTVDVDNETYTEIEKKPLNIYNMMSAGEEEFVVKDTLEVPSGKMSVRDVLKVDYRISDKELKPVTGKIVGKGVVNACVLYTGDNGNVEFMEFDIPFTEVFTANDVSENTNCELNYNITDMYYEVTEDSDGDNRLINLEFLVSAQIKAYNNVTMDIISDFYCPGLNTKLTRSECMISTMVHQAKTQNTLRDIVPIESNMPQIVGIYNVITKAYITKSAIENNKILAEGVIDCYILYLSDNIDNPVFSYKKEIPFSYLLDAPNCTAGMNCELDAEVEHCSYSLNVANEVEIRCIISLNAKVFEERKIELITDAQLSEIDSNHKMGIVIYFVQKGDSLWEIAKRYCVAMDDIIKLNNLDPEKPLMVGQQLIIPVSKKKTA